MNVCVRARATARERGAELFAECVCGASFKEEAERKEKKEETVRQRGVEEGAVANEIVVVKAADGPMTREC